MMIKILNPIILKGASKICKRNAPVILPDDADPWILSCEILQFHIKITRKIINKINEQ